MMSRYLSKFCIPLQFHEGLLLCTFLAQTIYTLFIRSPLEWKSLRLSSAQVKIWQIMPIFKRQVDSSPNFVSLFSFMKVTPLYFFSLNNIYFAQKEQIKMKIFETFKCSGQNSSNSWCQFWNDKSIPLQILHHSSLPWHITSLWILSAHFSYFGLKDPINMPITRLSIALVKICHIPHVIFQTTSQFSSNFASLFSVMKDISSVFF